jgi:phage tail sheath protein FI
MATYRTPDVYVEEISLFPPSVAEVETAVPAFIGYTERAEKNGVDLTLRPTRIDSMVEFEQYFGKGPDITPTVKLDDANVVKEIDLGTNRFYLYDSMRLFFSNGGGKCYIVSAGSYKISPGLGDPSSGFLGALSKIEKEDEPTILLAPDATLLSGTGLYDFQKDALSQCAKLMDRVVVCDLKHSGDFKNDVQEFRDNIGINNLKYGAAYVPWLKASFSKQVRYRDLTLKRYPSGGDISFSSLTKDADLIKFITEDLDGAVKAVDVIEQKAVKERLSGQNKTLKKEFKSLSDVYEEDAPYSEVDDFQNSLRGMYNFVRDIAHAVAVDVYASLTDTKDFKLQSDMVTLFKNHKIPQEIQKLIHHSNAAIGFGTGKIFADSDTKLDALISALNTIVTGAGISASATATDVGNAYSAAGNANAKGTLARSAADEAFSAVSSAVNDLLATAQSYEKTFESTLADKFGLYKNILTEINGELNELPPSGAVAGVYATVDRERGVWKAPANVSLNAVLGPAIRIDSKEQEDLNVDANAGKSINAIRAFTGKGTLVWGARTLAGNDNEWRYVPVRRFFNMVEESVKKSTYWAVFEPNDANTWIKVKSMIENYLIQKWREGALAGAKPEHAFFVKVGLGITMTAQDILEGRMNVEIGMAAVRPAEFIILKFSHKMQES